MPYDKVNTVPVNNGPLPGEDNRASDNFSIAPPWPCTAMKWTAVDAAGAPIAGVIFDLYKDITWGGDEMILENVASGSTTAPKSGDKLYFSNIKGAPSSFKIVIEGEHS